MKKHQTAIILVLICFVSSIFVQGPVFADDKDQITINDPERVYYGNPRHKIANPGVVDSSMIFKEIPAYQKILDEGLTNEDAKYWILMEKANKTFKAALRKTARKLKIDLIAEIGAIEIQGKEIKDITDKVIEAL